MENEPKIKKFAFYNVVILLITVQLVIVINYWYFVFKNIGQASINDTISYQGKLVDSNGAAVPDGDYNMEFDVYTALATGTPVWTERWDGTSQNGHTGSQVTVVDGIFSVDLNSLCADWTAGTCVTSGGVDFNSNSLYLEVKFDSDTNGSMDQTFTPRKRFSSVAYSMNSAKLDGKLIGTSGNSIPLLDGDNTWSGAETFSGAVIMNVADANLDGLKIVSSQTVDMSNPPTSMLSKKVSSWYAGSTMLSAIYPFGSLQSIPTSPNYPAFIAGALPNASPTDLVIGLLGTGALAIHSDAGIIQLGSPTLGSVAHVGINTTNPTNALDITINGSSEKGVVVTGAYGQTANLLELQDNANASLFSVTSAGVLTSGVPEGTMPFSLASTTLITNLNADLLDGIDSLGFVQTSGNSGNPMTGDLYLSKANPELRLIDSGNLEYSRITRSDTNNQLNLYNRVSDSAVTSYQLNLVAAQQITTSYNVDLDTDTFSVSAWIKINNISSNTYTIFGATNAGYVGGYWILLHRADRGGVVLQSQGAGQVINFTTPASNLTAGQWAHIVMVKSGSNVKIYQNNVLITDETINNLVNFTATPLQIGGLVNSNYFSGSMDETTFWSKSLTEPEITTLYNSGSGLYGSAESGLAIGYHFNEGSGTSITDYSGLSNTGTLSGSVTWGAGEKAQPTSSYTEVSVIQNENGATAGTSTTTIGDATGTVNINGTTVKVGTGDLNWLTFTNGATGVSPVFSADGETNVGLTIKPKGTGSITIPSQSTTAIPLVVKGILDQTANLQEWQDSTGAIKASVGFSGIISGLGITLTDPSTADCGKIYTVAGVLTCGTDAVGGGFSGGTLSSLLTLNTQTRTDSAEETSVSHALTLTGNSVIIDSTSTAEDNITTTYDITAACNTTTSSTEFKVHIKSQKAATTGSFAHTTVLTFNSGGQDPSVSVNSGSAIGLISATGGYEFKCNPFTGQFIKTVLY